MSSRNRGRQERRRSGKEWKGKGSNASNDRRRKDNNSSANRENNVKGKSNSSGLPHSALGNRHNSGKDKRNNRASVSKTNAPVWRTSDYSYNGYKNQSPGQERRAGEASNHQKSRTSHPSAAAPHSPLPHRPIPSKHHP
jgi:hypothetical protein